ncbi:MAG: hypothetical protein BRD30_13545 [Bacteroidetes bacterium QH_2_63_10]|nr:MAG: hypothetical protein BRD30_13545 [Bacteroidetes bacterium QH_2_63_10]
MHDQLDTYRSNFLALKDEATALVAGVDEDMLRRPPNPDTWSVAQILDHVNTAGWLLLNSLEQAIQDASQNGPYGEPPFRYGFVSRWFVRSMKPEEFRALQDQFATCVVDAEGLDLRRLRVSSPAVPLLRISVGAWFEATVAHQQRHLDQGRDVIQALGVAQPST